MPLSTTHFVCVMILWLKCTVMFIKGSDMDGYVLSSRIVCTGVCITIQHGTLAKLRKLVDKTLAIDGIHAVIYLLVCMVLQSWQ